MSHYCTSHPRYSAKKEPNSLCGRCYELWHLRCPERKEEDQKHLVSQVSKPPRKG